MTISPTRPAASGIAERMAKDIPVAQFTLLLQWPLILEPTTDATTLPERIRIALQDTRTALEAAQWQVVDGVSVLAAKGESAAAAADQSYGEFVYFHDFLQEVLYPTTATPEVTILRHAALDWFTVTLPGSGDAPLILRFKVPRRTLHLFETGCAIFTLELEWTALPDQKLMLDQVQTALDHIRRSYAPFFFADGTPGRCPQSVRLEWAGLPPDDLPVPKKAAVMAQWRKARTVALRDVPVFDHWRKLIAPLKLLSEGGPWRDPSDERIPMNSFIRLENTGGDAATLNQISHSDWVRIADAETPSGASSLAEAWPYNSSFAANAFDGTFYDRFMTDPAAPWAASRHIIAGAHYSLVGAGSEVRDMLHGHFRRHYAQMSLIARLELASLLAVSSRLTAAVGAFRRGRFDREAFEREVLAIQDLFLAFVHRFRFTGVSSQVQGQEMFAHWRQSLGLDVLFREVKEELDTAIADVRAKQEEREGASGRNLNFIVGVLGAASLVFAGLSVEKELAPLISNLGWVPETGGGGRDILFITAIVLAVGVFGFALLKVRPPVLKTMLIIWTVFVLAILSGASG